MRNAEATRERILDAAMAEFSAYGIAGARVDRIAKSAGCNKNLIYIYFESKEKLCSHIVQKRLARVYEELPFTPDDLPGYAARVFDFAMANPDLMRLMTWFGLEEKTGSAVVRGASRDVKVAALKKVQNEDQARAALPPGFLLTAVMALATAWSEVSPYGRSLDPEAFKRPAELRRNIAEAIRLLSEPKKAARRR